MKWAYLTHLLTWMLPVILGQWLIGFRILRRNWLSLAVPSGTGLIFFSLIDSVAVRQSLWHFDPRQNLGIFLGPLPFEEVLFFGLTSLLVAQSLILFLPGRFRR